MNFPCQLELWEEDGQPVNAADAPAGVLESIWAVEPDSPPEPGAVLSGEVAHAGRLYRWRVTVMSFAPEVQPEPRIKTLPGWMRTPTGA